MEELDSQSDIIMGDAENWASTSLDLISYFEVPQPHSHPVFPESLVVTQCILLEHSIFPKKTQEVWFTFYFLGKGKQI